MTGAVTDDPRTLVSARTVSGTLRTGAARHPDRALLVYDDLDGNVTTYSWQQVLDRAHAMAARLEQAGVGAGDRVHVHLGNRPEFLFAWFAAAELGALIVPTNTGCSEHELAYILDHAGTRTSIAEADCHLVVEAARRRAGIDGPLLVCERDELAQLPSAPREAAPVAPETPLAVMYTSGTTSNPKGVLVTHANYVWAGEVVAKSLRLSPEDRVLTVLPLFHANAQYYTTMGTLVSGGTLILSRRFSASRFMDQAVRHRATVASLFATPVRMILSRAPAPHWREHALRVVLFAQNLTDDELRAWDERIGAPLLQLYGMTETIGPPLINPLGDERRADAIGRVSLGYTCRVVRADGSPADVDEPGELLVGGVPGVSLMAGYLDDPVATEAALADGWMRTGDLVRVDRDGFHYFVDREKDMIKRSGENVAASEVEAVLLAHPRVGDAAVVGIPDPVRDEQIVAFVVPAAGEALDPGDVQRWCAERMAKFRVPSVVRVRDELPRTSVGKIQKGVLREAALDDRDPAPA